MKIYSNDEAKYVIASPKIVNTSGKTQFGFYSSEVVVVEDYTYSTDTVEKFGSLSEAKKYNNISDAFYVIMKMKEAYRAFPSSFTNSFHAHDMSDLRVYELPEHFELRQINYDTHMRDSIYKLLSPEQIDFIKNNTI